MQLFLWQKAFCGGGGVPPSEGPERLTATSYLAAVSAQLLPPLAPQVM